MGNWCTTDKETANAGVLPNTSNKKRESVSNSDESRATEPGTDTGTTTNPSVTDSGGVIADQPPIGASSITSIGSVEIDAAVRSDTEDGQPGASGSGNGVKLVDVPEMGVFIGKKLTEKALNKLWVHFGPKNGDSDNIAVDSSNVLKVLTFTAVLYVSYSQRAKGQRAAKLNKNDIRNELRPLSEWLIGNKLVGSYQRVGRNEFKGLFSAWLQEYTY